MGATAAVTLAVAGTAAQVDAAKAQKRASRRSERRQKEANRIEKARTSVERAISRRRAIAQRRQAQAFNIASAQTQGIAAGSSAVQGAQSALGSNLATSFAAQQRAAASGQSVFDLRQAAAFDVANANANAALKSTFGSAATQLGSFAAANFSPTP